MDFLVILNRLSYVLMMISLIYTLYEFYIAYRLIEKTLVQQKDLMSKILIMMKNKNSKEFIFNSLLNEGYSKEEIISKFKDIYDLLGVKKNQ